MINLPERYANILHQFSAGNMADTFLCEDKNLKRKVVVKSLKSGIEPHRLLDELAALSAIRSQYVVQVLDVIIENGKPIGFVEEFLAGNALQPCVSGVHSSVDALKILYPIAAGISDIHAHGRIHRDLKPDNMRYDIENKLKIFDFGLAKLNTTAGTRVLYFTDGYTAPESFRRNHDGLHLYDFPIDVYAFGCVAIWLLNNGSLPDEMLGYTPTLPSGFSFSYLPISVDAMTGALLLRCLDPNPNSRPTIAECKDHIGKEILRDRHRMVLTSGGTQYILSATQRSATISGIGNSSSSSIAVSYDGLDFIVRNVTGHVAINNSISIVGQKLFGSTVIVLGSHMQRRVSIACDVSHPEVML